MARSGGRNERIVDIAMILANGWLRLADIQATVDAEMPTQKRSISLAMNSKQMEVSDPGPNGPISPLMKRGTDVYRSASESS